MSIGEFPTTTAQAIAKSTLAHFSKNEAINVPLSSAQFRGGS